MVDNTHISALVAKRDSGVTDKLVDKSFNKAWPLCVSALFFIAYAFRIYAYLIKVSISHETLPQTYFL